MPPTDCFTHDSDGLEENIDAPFSMFSLPAFFCALKPIHSLMPVCVTTHIIQSVILTPLCCFATMPREYRTSLSSRERNRMHARKTRQRKKEHIALLQNRADTLKQEQLKLQQVINEKNTASILVGLFATDDKKEATTDPRIEELLLRPTDDIPDASKVPELPALILPGQYKTKKGKNGTSNEPTTDLTKPLQHELPDDGIDYGLLGKDRSQCTPEELDKIRRERNRMHAKRTRDRKRIFMEEMEAIIKKLEEENELLRGHLVSLGGDPDEIAADSTPLLASPLLQSSEQAPMSPPVSESGLLKPKAVDARSSTGMQVTANQLKSLLMASASFENKDDAAGVLMAISSGASQVSSYSNGSENSSVVDQDDARSLSPRNLPPKKRQRLHLDSSSGNTTSSGLPISITTTTTRNPGTAIGV